MNITIKEKPQTSNIESWANQRVSDMIADIEDYVSCGVRLDTAISMVREDTVISANLFERVIKAVQPEGR